MTYVYLHVPFCPSRCIYCDFYVELEKHHEQAVREERFVAAVCAEIEQRWGLLAPKTPLKSFYVGGGTPSLLSAGAYERILATLKRFVAFDAEAELTLEANPKAFASEPSTYRALGFNRLSLGVQSFNNAELQKLSRNHRAKEALDSLAVWRAGGFQNCSIDLMAGIPLQTLDSWQASLKQTVALGLQHVSFYGLQLEAGTPLERLVETPAYPLPDEDLLVTFYERGVQVLEAAGFEQYEFSNFAQPGYESVHNQAYWQQLDTWAFGPGAHGYTHPWRYENTPSLAAYLQNPLGGVRSWVSREEQLENWLIFGLRRNEGIVFERLQAHPAYSLQAETIETLLKTGKLLQQGAYLRLNPELIPYSNTVLQHFKAC